MDTWSTTAYSRHWWVIYLTWQIYHIEIANFPFQLFQGGKLGLNLGSFTLLMHIFLQRETMIWIQIILKKTRIRIRIHITGGILKVLQKGIFLSWDFRLYTRDFLPQNWDLDCRKFMKRRFPWLYPEWICVLLLYRVIFRKLGEIVHSWSAFGEFTEIIIFNAIFSIFWQEIISHYFPL